jgi:hypothetical protein
MRSARKNGLALLRLSGRIVVSGALDSNYTISKPEAYSIHPFNWRDWIVLSGGIVLYPAGRADFQREKRQTAVKQPE